VGYRLPEGPVPPQLLEDLIEGRLLAAPRMGQAGALARLAADCRQLRVAGPDALAAARMRRRYVAYIGGEHAGLGRWLSGWLGAGPLARPLRERLAAGVMLVAAAGGSVSYATGVAPQEAMSGLADLAGSVLVNLAPHNGGSGELSIDGTPSPTGTAGRSEPSPQATAGASTTPGPARPSAGGPVSQPAGAEPPQDAPTTSPPGLAAPAASATPSATKTPTPSPTAALPAATPSAPGGAGTTPPTATPIPSPASPSPTPVATSTPAPTSTPPTTVTPTPTATGTPYGDDDEEEDEREDDV
jgi:hypothetical protein